MLRIRLFGGASIEAEDGPLSGPAAQRHRLALLALLAVAWPAGVSRDKLIASLWPERDARRARNLLSQAVHAVRKALGEEVVTSAGDELRFDREVVACDLLQFRAALAVGDDARAADLKRGPFLDGFFLPDAPGFEHWLDEQRARIARDHARALERLATGAEERCDSRSAAEWWHRLLELDPYSARAVIRLMDALASAGDRAEAIRLADAHGSLVRSEFGAEPNPDVVALADRLRRGKEAGSVTRPSRVDGVPPARLAAQLPAPGWALIGRDAESERLSDAWRIATTRGAHVAVISGEPGIGKTRLAEELFLRVRRNRIPAARTRSWAVEGRLAYAPVTEWLWSEALHARLAGLDPAWLAEVSHLLPGIRSGRSDIPEPEPLNDGWRRRRLFDALIQVIRVRQDPLLLLLDDLQWTDPDTLQWIHYLVRTEPDAPVLFVGTLRPGELSREHALPEMLLELRRRDQLTEIALGPLDRDAAGALASRVAGRDLSATETARLHRDTDGNPLFVIESVRAGLDEPSTAGGAAERDAVSYTSPVNAVIRARLARLSGPAHRLAGFAATIGREFTSDVLALAAGLSEEALTAALDELWQRRIVREHGSSAWDFSHDRLREVAYAELSPARRRLRHRKLAEALEHIHGSDPDGISARVAAHYDHAGLPLRAIPFYERAAAVSRRVYALEERIGHLKRVVALLAHLPSGNERDRRELSAQLAIAADYISTRGWSAPEVREACDRARQLATKLGAQDELIFVLYTLQSHHIVLTELDEGYAVGRQVHRLTANHEDPLFRMMGPQTVAMYNFTFGEFENTVRHFEEALRSFDRADPRCRATSFSVNTAVMALVFLSHTVWHLGHPDRALDLIREATAFADDLAHPFSQAVARGYASMLRQFRGEVAEAAAHAEETCMISSRYDFPYYHAWGTIIRGWARSRQGQAEQGESNIRDGLEVMDSQGARLRRPYYLGLLAEAILATGRRRESQTLLDEALELSRKTGERWMESDLHRRRGEVLALAGDAAAAGAAFRRALEVAREQRARSPELRALVGLTRLSRNRDDAVEVCGALARLYAVFREGLDTPVLEEARQLLDDVRGERHGRTA